ncbi:MAG: hypothetical protein AAGE94_22930, partial [Acidobacteriota bacterium]
MMRLSRIALLALLTGFAASPSVAQNPPPATDPNKQATPMAPAADPTAPARPGRVSVAVEPVEVTVGDRIRATITVAWMGAEPSAAIRFPTWQETWGDAEILTTSDVGTEVDDAGRRVWRQTVELTAWDVGLVDLPVVTVALPLADETIELESPTPAAAFTVVSLLPPAEDPAAAPAPGGPGSSPPGGVPDATAELDARPSAPPAELRLAQERFLLTAGALALALGLATTLLLRRLGALPLTGDGAEAIPDPFAHLAPLDELAARLDRLDPTRANAAHTGLSLALRRFLGRRLEAPSVESTTTEIQRDLQRRSLPADLGQ